MGQWLQANKLAAYVEVFSEMEITGANVCELDDSDLKDLFVRSRHLDIHDILSCWDAGHAEAAYQVVSQGVGEPMSWNGKVDACKAMLGMKGEDLHVNCGCARRWRASDWKDGVPYVWVAVVFGCCIRCVRCVLCRAG